MATSADLVVTVGATGHLPQHGGARMIRSLALVASAAALASDLGSLASAAERLRATLTGDVSALAALEAATAAQAVGRGERAVASSRALAADAAARAARAERAVARGSSLAGVARGASETVDDALARLDAARARERYGAQRCDALRAQLRARGLRRGGRKAALVERLVAHDAAAAAADGGAPTLAGAVKDAAWWLQQPPRPPSGRPAPAGRAGPAPRLDAAAEFALLDGGERALADHLASRARTVRALRGALRARGIAPRARRKRELAALLARDEVARRANDASDAPLAERAAAAATNAASAAMWWMGRTSSARQPGVAEPRAEPGGAKPP